MILEESGLWPVPTSDGRQLVRFPVTSRLFQPRMYVIIVEGIDSNGRHEEVNSYAFRVSKSGIIDTQVRKKSSK